MSSPVHGNDDKLPIFKGSTSFGSTPQHTPSARPSTPSTAASTPPSRSFSSTRKNRRHSSYSPVDNLRKQRVSDFKSPIRSLWDRGYFNDFNIKKSRDSRKGRGKDDGKNSKNYIGRRFPLTKLESVLLMFSLIMFFNGGRILYHSISPFKSLKIDSDLSPEEVIRAAAETAIIQQELRQFSRYTSAHISREVRRRQTPPKRPQMEKEGEELPNEEDTQPGNSGNSGRKQLTKKINGVVVDAEDSMASRSDLTAVRNTAMTPLRPKDKEHFSIRMSPYKFAERAYAVVEFYAKCDAVEQIQLLWDLDDYTDQENKEVEEVMGKIGNGKVVLDKRRGTTLHDKFDLKVAPPTYGMLMVEDEIVFACDALKMGFYRWTRHPERLVGYEPRLHKENAFQWEYASYTDAMSANRYSMVRLSSTFIHVDYLKLYINYLPRSMYDAIVDSKKCEGIAMSLFVSSLTGGRPPLLADYWATQSKVVLYSPNGSRSDTRKVTLHACVDTFVTELELRYKHMKIRDAHLFHGIFSFGSKLKEDMEEGDYTIPDMNEKEKNIRKKVSHWNSDNFKDKVGGLKKNLKAFMTKRGLVKDTDPWKKKYGFSKKLSKKKRN